MIVHGLDLSYFTGKLEGYLRLKGLAYRLEPMDTGRFRALGDHAGVRQMPHLTLTDGRLLTDTVTIIDALEHQDASPSLTPQDPVTDLIAHLVEAFADEHLWRPALYFRWAFEADARQASRRLAEGMMRDIPAPLWLRRAFILHRQRRLYLKGEGIGRRQARVVEADYLALLDALEPVFRDRDWLLGDAPTRADVGLFGPFFRHFLCDPTPGRIMRERAPATAAWAMRLWASSPGRTPGASELRLSSSAADLAPLFALIADHFLPEAAANTRACAEGSRTVRWSRGGAVFRYRANPYRAWRLSRLASQYAALACDDRDHVAALLGQEAIRLLVTAPILPTPMNKPGQVCDRWWRPVATGARVGVMASALPASE